MYAFLHAMQRGNINAITAPLKDHIVNQENEYGYDILNEQLQRKAVTTDTGKQIPSISNYLINNYRNWPGASSWLTTLPLTKHGFTQHKAAFHDALTLRYGWLPNNMPST